MNTQAFNTLIVDNYEFLLPAASSLTRNHEDAKDLVQETLARAITHKDKYKPGTNIRGWLYTIMRNIFINNYRRNKKFTKVSSELPPDFFLYQARKVATNGGVVKSGMRDIKQAINKLPDAFRLSFEMHFAGYKYQEIADKLEEPLGTIKSRIHFARKLLTSKLERN